MVIKTARARYKEQSFENKELFSGNLKEKLIVNKAKQMNQCKNEFVNVQKQ